MLQEFLDTIFFTCGMLFHNTCDLAIAVIPNNQTCMMIQRMRIIKIKKISMRRMIVTKMNSMNLLKTWMTWTKTWMTWKKSLMIIWRIPFVNFFQGSLLIIHGLVHRKSKNHTTQLESTRTFALNVEAWRLIEQKKMNNHIAMVVVIIPFQKNG